MAPDTTRDKLADDLSGTLPPSCKHMEREEYRDCVLQMLEDLEQLGRRDGCIAAAWALDALPSLQRELAEARASLDEIRYARREYATGGLRPIGLLDTIDRVLAPGPSDAKGDNQFLTTLQNVAKNLCQRAATIYLDTNPCACIYEAFAKVESRPSLTPLTDPSVRGVLIQCAPDEETTGLYGEFGLRGSFKLRPASEFGVDETRVNLRIQANNRGEALSAIGTALGMHIQFSSEPPESHRAAILEAIAKLRSTPAEPAQKLVPLPDDVVVYRIELGRPGPGDFWRLTESDKWHEAGGYWGKDSARVQVLRKLDPALYGVDAERVRELEADVEKLQKELAEWVQATNREAGRANNAESEAERLRKAMSEAREWLSGIALNAFSDVGRARSILKQAAITPPTAAQVFSGDRPVDTGDWVYS